MRAPSAIFVPQNGVPGEAKPRGLPEERQASSLPGFLSARDSGTRCDPVTESHLTLLLQALFSRPRCDDTLDPSLSASQAQLPTAVAGPAKSRMQPPFPGTVLIRRHQVHSAPQRVSVHVRLPSARPRVLETSSPQSPAALALMTHPALAIQDCAMEYWNPNPKHPGEAPGALSC